MAAGLAAGPAVPGGRLGAAVTAVWLAAAAIHAARIHAAARSRAASWPAALLPGRLALHGWDHLAVADQARVFALAAPAAVPAGLGLAGLAWAWRRYAVNAGLGGMMASAAITFDVRQWKRQVRTAKGLIKAPGAVPLLARGGQIPVGGTIRAVGHRWNPVLSLPSTACGRHMVIVGSTGSGNTYPALS